MSEVLEAPEQETPAQDELRTMLREVLGETLNNLKSESTKPQLLPDGEAEERSQPHVKGEFVPAWQKRSFNYLHGIANSQSKEHERVIKGQEQLGEDVRQKRAMHFNQAKEEDQAVATLISGSGLSAHTQARLHSSLTGPAGEFALPKPFLAQLFVFIEQYGLARRLARVVNMGSKDIDLKSISSKPTATWTGEADLYTASDLALAEGKLTVSKLGAVTSITKEVDVDSFVALLPTWLSLLAEDMAKKEDQAWLLGDGTSTYGTFTGIANFASVQANTLGSGDLNFSDVVEADLRTTRNLLSTTRQQGAGWIMHRILWDKIEQFESTGGDRIVQTRLTEDGKRVLNLLGHPVYLSEAMVNATADVANVDFAFFGNYMNSLMGVRRGIVVESTDSGSLSNSNGVVTLNAFQQDAILLKISERVGFATPSAMQDGFAVMQAPAS